MNYHPSHSKQDFDDENLDSLLQRSPTVTASDQFVDKVLLAAHQHNNGTGLSKFMSQQLTAQARNNRFLLTGTLAAALVIACIVHFSPTPIQSNATVTLQHASSQEHNEDSGVDSFAELQQVADQEVLLAATEHMNAFSDSELASLMGF